MPATQARVPVEMLELAVPGVMHFQATQQRETVANPLQPRSPMVAMQYRMQRQPVAMAETLQPVVQLARMARPAVQADWAVQRRPEMQPQSAATVSGARVLVESEPAAPGAEQSVIRPAERPRVELLQRAMAPVAARLLETLATVARPRVAMRPVVL